MLRDTFIFRQIKVDNMEQKFKKIIKTNIEFVVHGCNNPLEPLCLQAIC